MLAQANLVAAGSPAEVEEVVADKGYHDNRWLAECAAWDVRTYMQELGPTVGEYETIFRDFQQSVKAAPPLRTHTAWRGSYFALRVQPGLVAAQTLRVDQAAQRPRRGGGPLRPREVNANNSGQIGFC